MIETMRNRHLARQWFRAVFPPVFAFVYALFLSQLPVDAFSDRVNYLSYARYSNQILDGYASGGIMRLLANEPLWLLWNVFLGEYFDAETTIRVIVFVPAFLVSWVLLRQNSHHIWWMVFFLFMPQVIRNHITALRQGTALAIFLFGFYANKTWARYILMAVSGTLHSSYLMIMSVDMLTNFMDRSRVTVRSRLVIISAALLIMTIFLLAIASILGARQGTAYAEVETSASGLGFVFWLAVLILFVSATRQFLSEHMLSAAIIALYLMNYIFNPMLAGRLFESSLFIVFTSGLALRGWRRQAFLGAIVLYTFLMYLLRLSDPLLGFGPQ